jgi:hypothetical protein
MKYFKYKCRNFTELTIPSEIFITKSWFDKSLDNVHLVLQQDKHLFKILMWNGIEISRYLTGYSLAHDVNFIEFSLESFQNIRAFL